MEQTTQNNDTSPAASLKRGAEEIFRAMWASLFYSERSIGKGVLICSSDRSEGASTIACGLALAGSMPSGVARVALVDFNLRNPALHKMLNLEQSPGIGEIIVDGLAPESAAQRLNASLDVYTAGKIDDRALEILRSNALGSFLNILSDGYDHVLVDVAPVNHFPDAQVLVGMLKDVVLVAHTDRTPREAVAQAKKRLESGGGKIAGLVLNLRTYPIPKFLYKRV